MELRHLRTIAAVARHGSFTKAAEELYLAQSAISQQIRRLERELGVEVFRRTSRRVELTRRTTCSPRCAPTSWTARSPR
jgi:DNA-binding transcriptional LysR family regulator